MYSNDIAKLAGVTVRTLRHYHAIGLLPEAPRAENGYRVYGVQHLIRLIRIGQMTGLGMSLSDIPAALDRNGELETSALDELDQSLARQIQALENQRTLIAALRQGRGPLDMPPELVASLVELETGRAAAATKAGREQAVLLGQMVDGGGVTQIASLYVRLAGPELSGVALQLGQRFDALGVDSDEREISELADDYLKHLGPWLTEFEQIIRKSGQRNAEALLSVHAAESANPQQRKMMAMVSAGLRGF